MSKRRATTQLTRDDLDREDSPEREEPEYAGSGVASAEVLSQRKIITARRSLTSASSAKSSPFASINLTSTGKASGIASSTSSSSSFSALSSSAVLTPSPAAASMPTFGSTIKKYQPTTPSPLTRSDAAVTNGTRDQVVREREDIYYEKIRSLNHSFQQHMTSHLQKDPEADYSINCQEYINYLIKLRKDYPIIEPEPKEKDSGVTAHTKPAAPVITATSASPATSGSDLSLNVSSTTSNTVAPAASPFVLPAPVSSSKFPVLTFGQKAPAFGSGFLPPAAPSSSAASAGTAVAPVKEETGEEDEYVPPKNEEINVEEEDSVFSKR